MNKTFKVVFNKVRGAMTVVNEVTSCVQAKGTKAAVIAVGVLAASSATATVITDSGDEIYRGGAEFVENGAQYTVEGGSKEKPTEFKGYSVTDQGGAIFNGGKTDIGDWTAFVENSAGVAGGAISNNTDAGSQGVTIRNNVSFDRNSSGMGGAIFNQRAEMIIGNEVRFTANKALGREGELTDVGSGGAIMNQADANKTTSLEIGEGAVFESNSAAKSGGAISNYAWQDHEKHFNREPTTNVVLTIGDGAEFTLNTAGVQGGAIYNDGKLELGQTKFDQNSVTGQKSNSQGGAIFNAGTMDLEAESSFTNNEAWIGGAISNNGTSTEAQAFIGDSVTFKNNHAQWAGAIFNQRASMKIGEKVEFINNYSEGAATGAGVTGTDYGDGGMGGAIMNQSDNNERPAVFEIGAESYFEGNESKQSSGGAIANYRHATADIGTVSMTIGADAQFISNTAAIDGGAIFNNATLTFEGDATFSGNMAGDKLNDIHNEGTINFKSGTLSLDGGITGEGTLKLTEGTTLNVTVGKEQSTSISNTIKVVAAEQDTVALVEDTAKVANLSLTFKTGYEKGTYTLFAAGKLEGGSQLALTENALYKIEESGTEGTYTISKKTTSEIMQSTGLTGNEANALAALINAETDNEILNEISTGVQQGNQAAKDAVTAMSPEAAPMVAQVQTDTAAQVFGVIGSRLGGSQGMASGDGTSGTALWVQGMVGTTDMDDTSKARGYSADSNGLALGLEAKPTDSTTIGMGFAYTNTDVDGFLRSTDVDSYTAFLYGEYKPANWYVNGILSYAWANYEEQANVLSQSVGAKYDADTLGLQLMGGLDLAVSGFTVTPEAGLRYYHISTDSYTNGMGTSVADSDEDVLTGVIGARFAKTFEVSPAMSVVPQVRLAMTYDIVDADNTSFVTLANGSSYSVDGETLDRFGFEAGVGVKAEMGDNFEMSLSYEGAWRGDYQNHAGILNAKYKF